MVVDKVPLNTVYDPISNALVTAEVNQEEQSDAHTFTVLLIVQTRTDVYLDYNVWSDYHNSQ